MKSSLKTVAGLLSAAILVLSITGCPQNADPNMGLGTHSHTFSKSWTNDATDHWHEATCEHATEISEKAAHTFGDYVSDNNASFSADGTKTRKCSVCGYKDTIADAGSKRDPASVSEFVKVTGGTVPKYETVYSYMGAFLNAETTVGSYYIGKYEVTQEQYKSVMDGQKVTTVDGKEYTLSGSPSKCKQGSQAYGVDNDKDHKYHPVESVTWYDALYYCNLLSEKEGKTKCYSLKITKVENGHIKEAEVDYYNPKQNGYRLPTKAEWEYAARGGDTTKPDWKYRFSGSNNVDDVCWYSNNNITGERQNSKVTDKPEGCGTHEVGLKAANRLGIYDMSGNVAEWCYEDEVSNTGFNDVLGGSWNNEFDLVSPNLRTSYHPNDTSACVGFRIVYTAN